MVTATMKDLITKYFNMGLTYAEIVYCLKENHDISISHRHLKRVLKMLHLDRNKTFSDSADVITFIDRQLQSSGQLHGYRWMQQKCKLSNLRVRREHVRIILKELDAEGTARRKARRLHRRVYFAPGPNYIWHLDCYDKLKPYGFCVSGCIDGFSRKIVWLHLSRNTSDPRFIGYYFMKEVANLGGCPKLVRGDLGTENGRVRDFQRFLKNNESSYLEGTSVHNQRIECWWSHLRKQCTDFWINLFGNLRDYGDFDGRFVDKNILQFCFMDLIRVDLQNTVSVWNSHLIRTSCNMRVPSGRPSMLYYTPELYNTRDYLQIVPKDTSDVCLAECISESTLPCDETVFDLCTLLMDELHFQWPTDVYEALELYHKLRDHINNLL